MSATLPPPSVPPSYPDDGNDVGEGKRRRAAHAEQRRIAERLAGDWRSTRGFSDGQRRALIGLLILFIGCIMIGLLRNPVFLDDPLPADAMRHAELVDRIDPNTADAATLSALPQLGESRAAAIVAYREQFRQRDPSRVVFQSVDDLMRVRGIGVAISRQMEPYLVFPATQAASAPSR